MSDVSLAFNLVGRDKVSGTMSRVAGNVAGHAARSAASTAVMAAAMASAAGWATALGGAGLTAAAGIGLIPGAALAASTALATLGLGTFGIGEAWKQTSAKTAAGGASAVNTAKKVAASQHEVKLATQGLSDAQKRALTAQQALSQARQDEARRLADMTRNLNGARLDEEGAVRAVADAEVRLNEARRTGNLDDIGDANLAYRQANQTLEDSRARVLELERDKTTADKNGVEGSEAVRSALDDVEESQRSVEEAQWRLAQAQQAVGESAGGAAGGIDKAAEAMANISPNARELITTLHSLGGGWRAMRLAVQDALFAGVAGDVKALSATYLPILNRRLVETAGGFNQAGHSLTGLMTSKGFASDMDASLGNVNAMLKSMAAAVTPLVNGFMQLVAVGSTFLPSMGNSTLSIAQSFEKWMVSARESGKLREWLQGAVDVLRDIWQIGANVATIIGNVFTANGNQAAGKDLLDTLVRGSAALAQWTGSAEGQEKIGNALKTLRDIIGGVVTGLAGLKDHGAEVSAGFEVTGTVVKFLADHSGLLAAALPYLVAGFIAMKAAETGANIASIVRVPLIAAQTVSNISLAASNRALAAAIRGSTTATGQAAAATRGSTAANAAGDAAQKRGTLSLVAHKVATIASSVATKAAAAAQWLLNAAMSANPLGLIIIAVLAIAAGLYLLWTKSETFRAIVTGAFDAVWGAIKAVWSWVSDNWPLLLAIITGPIGLAVLWVTRHWDSIKAGASAAVGWIGDRFEWFVGWVTGLPGRLARGAGNLFGFVGDSFRSAINFVIRGWNNFRLRIPAITLPVIGKIFDGASIDTPDIPYLATGGTATSAGLAVVGERGPELVKLGPGASVIPLDRAAANVGGGAGGRVVVDVQGAESEFKRLIRRMIRVDDLLQTS